jgi:phosphotransferase system enzyme I (PtsP)
LQVDACSVFLVNPNIQAYQLMAHVGFKHSTQQQIILQKNQGLVGWVALHEEPLNLENARQHPDYYYVPETGEEQYLAFLGVPIIHQGTVLGVLVAQQRALRVFNDDEETFLVTLSAQLAGVIAHALATDSLLLTSVTSVGSACLIGIAAAPGIALGQVVTVYPRADLSAVPERCASDTEYEIQIFHHALNATRDELNTLGQQLQSKLPPEEYALFDAYLKILESPALIEEVNGVIRTGLWAQSAWCQVIQRHIAKFSTMENEYLQERGTDVKDLGQRVLAHLQDNALPIVDYPEQTILMGEEVTAAQLAEVPVDKLAGIVTLKGSRNSHLAILARAMGIPTVTAVTGLVPHKLDGQHVIVDGHEGSVYVDPSVRLQKEFGRMLAEERHLNSELAELSHKPSQTLDGYTMPLYVNAGLVNDIPKLAAVGATGIGLYRTEILFMIRDQFPSEAHQAAVYQQVLRSCHPQPVAMRTLDIGGDKVLPYFTINEDNPFLGWRGIRVALDHPEIFLMQIRAMLQASVGLDNLQIMLPMISQLSELQTALGLINRAWYEVKEEYPELVIPKIGVMIEVPAAVYQAQAIAKQVDFLSIGTNDLTQYLLAVDRNNPRVADLFDHLHPAVLSAIRQVVKAAHAEQRPVTVCGEMAADPAAVLILLALGVDGLSMNANSVLRIKWLVRSLTMTQAEYLWQAVSQMNDAQEIRLYLEHALLELGLGKLIGG